MSRLHLVEAPRELYVPRPRLHLAEALPQDPGPWQMLEEVLASFRLKTVLSSIDFERLSVEIKQMSVRFAGVWNTRFADALYRSIEDSIGKGISASDWLSEASGLIKQYGGSTALGIYAPDITGNSMSSWYADLVFRQNTMNALNSARYAESFFGPALESDPFWMFSTAEDERVCDICGPLDGQVFSKIDSEGRKFLPSLHMGCRCEETDLDAAGVAAGGYKVSSGHDVGVVLPGDFNVDRLISVPEELRRAA
jgi:SPP1 gp7 family putative phage head morphogenesis protein